MNGRSILISAGCLLCGAAAAGRADIVVTLEAFTGDGPVTGPVAEGTELTIDVLLSVTPDEDPLADLRSLQFDTQATPDGLEVTEYRWTLDERGVEPNYFVDSAPPIVGADHIVGSTLELTVQPVRVGRYTVIANDSGEFSVTGGDAADPNNVDEGLRLRAGFAAPVDYSVFDDTVSGGAMDIEVGTDGGPGGNENGNDNVAGNDNDGGPGGNVNDNAPPRDRNVGPLAQVQFCGFGMMGAWVCTLAALVALRLHRRAR